MVGDTSITLLLFLLRLLFLVILYGFLGLLAWLVWRELKQGSRAAARMPLVPRGARLTMIAAGESGYATGRHFVLDAVTTIGRDLSNDIVIADDYASMRHARIERQEDERFWLVDVGSSNGTLLNGRAVRPNDPIPLDPGDVLTIGNVKLKME